MSGIGDLLDWAELGRMWEDRNVIAHRVRGCLQGASLSVFGGS